MLTKFQSFNVSLGENAVGKLSIDFAVAVPISPPTTYHRACYLTIFGMEN